MPTTVVRYQTKPDCADENQRLIEKVFAERAETKPDGLRYRSFRLADGVTFVHIAHVTTTDGSNPLTQTAAFREFTAAIAERCEVQPVALEATVVGSYG